MKKLSIITLIISISLVFLSGCSKNNITNEIEKDKKVTVYKDRTIQKKSNVIQFKTFSLLQLQEDFQQLQNTIDTQSPMLYTDKEELSRLFKTQFQLLRDNMGEIEFYRILSPIIAKLNCGHTNINFSKEFGDFTYKNGMYLPLTIKIIDNKAYAYQSLLSTGIPAGSEILSINDKTIEDIIKIFLDNISADGFNTTKKYYVMNNWFNDMYFNYIDSPEYFTITYKTAADNERIKTTLSAATKEQIDNVNKSSNSTIEQVSGPYSQTFEKAYAVLTIKSFAFYEDDSREKFLVFIDEFFKNLADKKISNLILDLRDNWGGDPYCTSHLFSYLVNEAKPYFSKEGSENYYSDLKQPITPAKNYFKGSINTLINGASFSSTGHLCALLKYHKIGVFIGEESGGSFVCTDSSRDITLNNSELKLHYSTAPWKVAVSELTPGRGVIPEHIITPTIQDYLNSKDVVKEFAIDLFMNGK